MAGGSARWSDRAASATPSASAGPGIHRRAPAALVVRWRDRRLFDPVVSHELAHLRHGDVALAWLTTSVWFALAPLLRSPPIVGLASGSFAVPGYAWRAAAARSRGGPGLRHPAQVARARRGPPGRPAARRSRRDGAGPRQHRGPTVGARAAACWPTTRPRSTSPGPGRPAWWPRRGSSTASRPASSRVSLPSWWRPCLRWRAPGRLQRGVPRRGLPARPLLAGSVGLGAWRDALVRRLSGRPNPSLARRPGSASGSGAR